MKREIAVFAGGCFWCTEAVFKLLKGVSSVVPGYTGGTKEDPTYEEVSSGRTGHAEAVKIEFDPKFVSFSDLLTVFFGTHDPTTKDRQGSDVGPQYRSAIFYTTPEQQEEALSFIRGLNDSSPSGEPIVTSVEPLGAFYEAEDYHRDYYGRNPDNQYCEVVINPKLKKVEQSFYSLLKAQQA
ncbi:MAG: peptide-methionine (S)-S-oxide reductase MsrA [Candidatus Taylorbacteria bacterium]|nr:peptide-methionine (S)-S-oxide reductase MsrA [Candidatus Taylorbacteria bacterium]